MGSASPEVGLAAPCARSSAHRPSRPASAAPRPAPRLPGDPKPAAAPHRRHPARRWFFRIPRHVFQADAAPSAPLRAQRAGSSVCAPAFPRRPLLPSPRRPSPPHSPLAAGCALQPPPHRHRRGAHPRTDENRRERRGRRGRSPNEAVAVPVPASRRPLRHRAAPARQGAASTARKTNNGTAHWRAGARPTSKRLSHWRTRAGGAGRG